MLKGCPVVRSKLLEELAMILDGETQVTFSPVKFCYFMRLPVSSFILGLVLYMYLLFVPSLGNRDVLI